MQTLLARREELAKQFVNEAFPRLSPIDKVIIEQSIRGYTQEAIARQLYTTQSNISKRLTKLKVRANVQSKLELCLKYLLCPHTVA